MEKVLYCANLHNFRSESGALIFSHAGGETSIAYSDVLTLSAESNMSAKNGAYVRFTLDTESATLTLDTDNPQFFDVLFDMISIELDVNLEELFNIAAAEMKTEKTIYTKKTED